MDSTFQVYGTTIKFGRRIMETAIRMSKYSKYSLMDTYYRNGKYYIILSDERGMLELRQTPHQLRKLLYPLVRANIVCE